MSDWIGRPIAPSQLQAMIGDNPAIRAYGSRPGRGLAASIDEYLRARLAIRTARWEEVQEFLRGCRYVKDSETHAGRDEVWLHPEDFERTRVGDCEDHAIWAWVQFIRQGLEARFTAGIQDGGGHAWVTLYRGGAVTVCETTAKRSAPFLVDSTRFLAYTPVWSVNGSRRFFTHA